MLAQEGSPSRRSSSSTVEAAIVGRRRKPRAVSDTGRSRVVSVTSQKLPRKLSLADASGGVFLVERERQRLHVEDGTRETEQFAEGRLLELDRNDEDRKSQGERDSQRSWKDWQSVGNVPQRGERDWQSCEKDSQTSQSDSQKNWRDWRSCEKEAGRNQSEGETSRNCIGRGLQRSGKDAHSERDSQRRERDLQRSWSECNSKRNTNEREGVHGKVTGDLGTRNQVLDRRTELTNSIEGITRFGGSSLDVNELVDSESNFCLKQDEETGLGHQKSNVQNIDRSSYPAKDRRKRFSGDNDYVARNGESRQISQDIGLVKISYQGSRDERNEIWRDVESRFDSLLTDRLGNELHQVTRFHSDSLNNSSVGNILVRDLLTSPSFAERDQNSQVPNVAINEESPDFVRVGDNRHSFQIVGQDSLENENDHQVLGNGVATSSVEEERSCTQVNNVESENNVTPRHRPKSWYAKTTTAEEEQAKARRRKTHPGHHADYQEALSSLLWQPYECQRELTTVCSSPDDSDVAYWLGCRLPEFRIPREEQDLRYRDGASRFGEHDLSPRYKDDGGSLSSSRTTSSLSECSAGGEVSDRDEWLQRLPAAALVSPQLPVATGCRSGAVASQAPDAGKNGSDMRSPVVDTAPLPAVVSSSSAAPSVVNNNNINSSNSNNNVSLVRCYAATSVSSVPSIDCVVASSSNSTNPVVRTFTSTEAQTDDVIVDTPAVVRPRERRRHHNRRQQPPIPPPTTTTPLTDRLPDILNSHLPPPYTTLPPPPHLGLPPPVPSIPVLTAVPPPGSPPPPLPHTPAAVSNLVAGLRFPFAIVPAARRRSRQYASSEEPKSCCGVVVSQAASVRWLMLLVLLVGLCCAFVGTLLLVTRAAGRDHLTLALLIIGVGVVLVGVSAAAWRLTSQDGGAASCRAMLGLAGPDELGASEPNRRFVPRLPPSYGRPHHPYAAMMYPEFQYRAPPPSYQASMQEYRLRLLLLDRHTTPVTNSMSPPPTYRSQAGSLLRAPMVTSRRDLIHYQVAASQQSDYSRPPSYRSRTSCSRSEPRGGPGGDSLSSHSRDPSQLSMTSDAGAVIPPAVNSVNVITVMGGHHEEAEPIIKLAPAGDESSLSPIAPKDDSKDGNLVTIVQTSSQSTGPVIVTISGNSDDGQCSRDTEMEILAHL